MECVKYSNLFVVSKILDLMVRAYLYFSGRFSWDLNMKGMTLKVVKMSFL